MHVFGLCGYPAAFTHHKSLGDLAVRDAVKEVTSFASLTLPQIRYSEQPNAIVTCSLGFTADILYPRGSTR